MQREDDAIERRNSLRRSLDVMANELADLDRKLANLDDAYAETNEKTVRLRLRAKMLELEEARTTLGDRRRATERELDSSEADRRTYSEWQTGLKELREQLAVGDPMLRSRMRNHLRSFITRIEVYTKGHIAEYDVDTKDGDDLRDYMAAAVPDADVPQGFVEYALAQRMSSRGRFVRVWYGDKHVDLVPEGSLATGLRDGIYHYPDLNAIWIEYQAL